MKERRLKYRQNSYGQKTKCGDFPDCPDKPDKTHSECRICPHLKR